MAIIVVVVAVAVVVVVVVEGIVIQGAGDGDFSCEVLGQNLQTQFDCTMQW